MPSHRRVALERVLDAIEPSQAFPDRHPVEADREELGMLLYAAYRGTIDDEGDSPDDARHEIDKVYAGGYGRFMPEASFLIESEGTVQAACLVTWFDVHAAPLIVFLMTRPEAKGQGMARHLLTRSLTALRVAGQKRATLIVTDGNEPAQHLYRSIGFVPFG